MQREDIHELKKAKDSLRAGDSITAAILIDRVLRRQGTDRIIPVREIRNGVEISRKEILPQ